MKKQIEKAVILFLIVEVCALAVLIPITLSALFIHWLISLAY